MLNLLKTISFTLCLAAGILLRAGPVAAADAVLVVSSQKPEHQSVALSFKVAFPGDYREINLEASDEKQRLTGEALKASPPGVVVVVGDLAAQLAKLYLEGIPVVYCDAVTASELTLTSGNNMGVYHEPDPVAQLEMIHELFPDRNKIAVMYSVDYAQLDESGLKDSAGQIGLELEIAALDSIKQVPGRVSQLLPNTDLLWIFSDPVVLSTQSIQYIVIQSMSKGVPVFGGNDALARGGATAAWVSDMADAGRQAAQEAEQILNGATPTPGSVSYPDGRLILNTKIAELLNISFPPEMVSQADKVIQ